MFKTNYTDNNTKKTNNNKNAKSSKIKKSLIAITISVLFTDIILFTYIIFFYDSYTLVKTTFLDNPIISKKGPVEENISNDDYDTKYFETTANNIPTIYRYRSGNKMALQNWLKTENSILSKEPYFSEIMESAKKYDLNPCLLFAITGREQSFVPISHPRAKEISNNPFNVFGSWQIYNTEIKDSANIACETIIKISKDRPAGVPFLKWLNMRNGTGGYAEDPLWHTGVNKFFEILNKNVY